MLPLVRQVIVLFTYLSHTTNYLKMPLHFLAADGENTTLKFISSPTLISMMRGDLAGEEGREDASLSVEKTPNDLPPLTTSRITVAVILPLFLNTSGRS